MTDLAIAILAGGQSERMGQDKATLELQGQRMLEHIAEVTSPIAPTAVFGRDDADRFDLPRIPFIPDSQPGLGPLGGLKTALEHFQCPVMLLGCDMPLLDLSAVMWLSEAFADSTADDGLISTRDGEVEPLYSVYRTAVLDLIDEALAADQKSLHQLVERGDFERRSVPSSLAERLTNINTREEYERLVEHLDGLA